MRTASVRLAHVALLLGACGGEVDAASPYVPPPPSEDASIDLPPVGRPDASLSFDVSITPVAPPDATIDVATVTVVDAEASVEHASDVGVAAAFDASLPDGGWLIAPHYPMPSVTDFGGPLLTTPVFTAVTFPGYDLTSVAENFVATVGTTPYWTDAVGEYGIGPATVNPPVVLTETAPTQVDDSAIQTWLAAKLDGTNPDFGTPTDQSVYVLFYPSGTSITLMGLSSCVEGGFGGYHNSVALTTGPWAGQNVAYAVLPECNFADTLAESLTESASHELIEASTDPLPLTNNPAYVQTDENDIVWDVVLGGGEVADMCAQNPNAFFQPAGYAYTVQRSWSNAAAAAGHDPCQPSAAGVFYFNAVARLDSTVTLTYAGQSIATEGLRIPLHTPETVEVDLYSDGPVGDWTVSASDLSDLVGGGPYLDFSWDHTVGTDGSVLHLTITPLAASPFGGQPFAIVSTSGGNSNYWFGYVSQD